MRCKNPRISFVFCFKLHFLRFLPPALSLELTDLYLKLFKPLKVNKKHFQELTREARVVRLEPGEAYALEEVTPADERLSILLKGKYVILEVYKKGLFIQLSSYI